MQQIEKNNLGDSEGFFTTSTWATTALGSPIALFASENLELLQTQAPIILIGGVHGDEPEGVRLAQDSLDWLTKQTKQSVCPWIVIPTLNVDGYKSGVRNNGRGVDLNRNYPSQDWVGEYTNPRYYPGPSAASEPEIRALVKLFDMVSPRLVIHCHSWHPCVIATGESAKKDGDRLGKSCGYEVRGEIGYPTPGSLSRYGWHDKKIPIICIEEQDDLKDLHTIWPRFKAGIVEIFTDRSARA
jgi:murein peptide amidase A